MEKAAVVENRENFTIDFVDEQNKLHSISVIGYYSDTRMIFNNIPFKSKSLWLDNEYGTHPIDTTDK